MIEAAAALLTWAGAALVVLSDGRRGLAAGLGVLALGFALLAITGGEPLAGLAVGAGGAVAAFHRWRSGPAGWGVMPQGSTPRLVLCIASGLLALWIAASITTGPGAAYRFAVLVVVGMMGARVLTALDSVITVTAVAALALAVGVASGLPTTSPGLLPSLAGALAAAGAVFMPRPKPDGA